MNMFMNLISFYIFIDRQMDFCFRLTEFDCTPSSRLTINEFMEIDLEAEHDPPAFINNRIKAKLQQLESEAGGMNTIESMLGATILR